MVPLLNAASRLADRSWSDFLVASCSIVGAVGAGSALGNLARRDVRLLASCLFVGHLIDACQWGFLANIDASPTTPVDKLTAADVVMAFVGLAQSFATCFAREEVAFRMLDAFLQTRGVCGLLTSLFLSVCWGLWHLPLVAMIDAWVIGDFLVVCIPFGLSLSFFWRRSGNLVVPAASHALGDVIRDLLTSTP